MNWRTIKNFGQVKYFNISYAVILIVPLLTSTFTMLNEKMCFHLMLPEALKSLYLASILYAIAIAIYQYKCPPIIKEYYNLQDYIDKNLEFFKNKAPDLKFYVVLAHLDQNTQAASYNEIITLNDKIFETTSEVEKTKLKIQLDEKLNSIYPSTVQNHLERKYNDANKKSCFYYWSSGILYAFGSLIITILLVIKTITVFNN